MRASAAVLGDARSARPPRWSPNGKFTSRIRSTVRSRSQASVGKRDERLLTAAAWRAPICRSALAGSRRIGQSARVPDAPRPESDQFVGPWSAADATSVQGMVDEANDLLRNLCEVARTHTGRGFVVSEFTYFPSCLNAEIWNEGTGLSFNVERLGDPDTTDDRPRWSVSSFFEVGVRRTRSEGPGALLPSLRMGAQRRSRHARGGIGNSP